MKKIFFPALLCFIFLLQACSSTPSSIAPELLEPEDQQKLTASVIRSSFSDTEVYEGFISSENIRLSFDMDGIIQNIFAVPGCYVSQGDVLLTLDTSEQEQKISDLNAEIADLYAEIDYTDALFANRMEYLKTELGQIIETDGYNTSYQLKLMDIDEYDLNYREAKQKLNAKLVSSTQTLTQLETLVTDASLTAPCSGYFYISSDFAENTYIQKHQTVCYIMKEDSLSFLSSYIDESDLKNAVLSVLIHGNSYPVSYIPLSVKERSALSLTEEHSRTGFYFSDETDLSTLHAGDAGFLIVKNNSLEQVLQVPVNALFHDSAGDYVYMIDNGTQKRQTVTVGPTNDIMTVIEDGLSEGDIVYVQQ